MRRAGKKPSKTSLTKKCDAIWSAIIRGASGGCAVCGSPRYLNAHHLIGRVNRATRWCLENGIALCPLHHEFGGTAGGEFSAHDDPMVFAEWLRQNRPEQWAWVQAHKQDRVKITLGWLQEQKARLESL